MLCKGCGFTNSNDASFCSMCGVVLTPTVNRQTCLGTVPCPSCSFLNESVAVYCRACGERVAAPAKVPAMAAVGAASSADAFMSLLEPLESVRSIVADLPSDVEEKPVATRHESLLAKLDRMEQDISSRLGEELPTYELEPEPELAQWDTKEDNLASLSSTLDGLIADLLDAEINEYLTPDFIHPDETGFPSPDAATYAPKPQKHERRVIDLLVIIALIIAVFLVGMTVGLWGSYALGF